MPTCRGQHRGGPHAHVLPPIAAYLPQERIPQGRRLGHLGGLLDQLQNYLLPPVHLHSHHGHVQPEGDRQKHEYQQTDDVFQYTELVDAQGHL